MSRVCEALEASDLTLYAVIYIAFLVLAASEYASRRVAR